ncbi:hypothetical protein [Streptomyces albipurpureus]|uniref:Conjugal transfer protein n=1 Tax=Streptomyces albipurpureus TaxID=2897419 RepID=A0ABT0V100_9ACTN|nr:hypothetical protein [Streptomyces sp. CWNU-1]MCM2394394.1 hypothetical protein [Streptomyces sp. CWNU-1]
MKQEQIQNERERELTRGQAVILGAAAVPMLIVGGLGAWGTFTNIKRAFPENATALGVVAAGEGATLVLALVMVGLTLLGQSSPHMVRLGLWLLPAVASGTGAVIANGMKEAVVNAVTPMAMSAAAEGIGLLARRIVVYRTGVDIEAQRRNAATLQKMAVLRALAANHPKARARKRAELASWRLARKIGVGDDELGAELVVVQRKRMTSGADGALAGMFAPAAVTPALTGSVTPALEPGAGRDASGTPAVTDTRDRHTGVTAAADTVTAGVTQVNADTDSDPSRSVGSVTDLERDAVTAPGTDTGIVTDHTVTVAEPSRTAATAVTLQEIATVTGVSTPVTGERLSDAQLVVVLRHLRYREDPPVSYRQAVGAFREAGFVGGEERIRRTWGALMSHEENDPEEDGEEAGPRP